MHRPHRPHGVAAAINGGALPPAPAAETPAQAPDNPPRSCPPPEPRSSGARPSRTPAPPGSGSSCRLRGRPRRNPGTRTRRTRRRAAYRPRPADLGHAFRELGIVEVIVGLAVLARWVVGERPAGLGHRLHGDDAVGDAHAQRNGRGAVAAVRHAQHALERRADLGLLGFQRDVSGCRRDGDGDQRADDGGRVVDVFRFSRERMRGAPNAPHVEVSRSGEKRRGARRVRRVNGAKRTARSQPSGRQL